MEVLIKLADDFPLQNLMDIGDYLQEQDVLVSDSPDPDNGVYFIGSHLAARQIGAIRTVLLPDRNVVSRIQQVARRLPVNRQCQTAAAILAFAQGLGIQIDPSIAFHEMAFNEGNEAACEELQWFRVADRGNIYDWIAIGLGELDKLANVGETRPIEYMDLAKPLRRWRTNYIAVLKIAELELNAKLNAVQKVTALLEWMRDEVILAGPAAVLALLYFAPNSPPKKGLLKGLRSTNRQEALAGAKNAAWDVTYLSDFARRINEQSESSRTRYIFATFDKRLRDLARFVIGEYADLDADQSMARSFERWWQPKDAQRLSDLWAICIKRSRSQEWWDQFKGRPDYKGELISHGEGILLDWQA